MSEVGGKVLHDLLNQVSIVKGLTDLLLREEKSTQRREMLRVIKRNAEGLARALEALSRNQGENREEMP